MIICYATMLVIKQNKLNRKLAVGYQPQCLWFPLPKLNTPLANSVTVLSVSLFNNRPILAVCEKYCFRFYYQLSK